MVYKATWSQPPHITALSSPLMLYLLPSATASRISSPGVPLLCLLPWRCLCGQLQCFCSNSSESFQRLFLNYSQAFSTIPFVFLFSCKCSLLPDLNQEIFENLTFLLPALIFRRETHEDKGSLFFAVVSLGPEQYLACNRFSVNILWICSRSIYFWKIFRDPWVAQRFGACLWPRARSWRPGIESHVGLPVHGACFSLCLCLCLSLSLCVTIINK